MDDAITHHSELVGDSRNSRHCHLHELLEKITPDIAAHRIAHEQAQGQVPLVSSARSHPPVWSWRGTTTFNDTHRIPPRLPLERLTKTLEPGATKVTRQRTKFCLLSAFHVALVCLQLLPCKKVPRCALLFDLHSMLPTTASAGFFAFLFCIILRVCAITLAAPFQSKG